MRTRFVAVSLFPRGASESERATVPEGVQEGESVNVRCGEGGGKKGGSLGETRREGMEVYRLKELKGKGEEVGFWWRYG